MEFILNTDPFQCHVLTLWMSRIGNARNLFKLNKPIAYLTNKQLIWKALLKARGIVRPHIDGHHDKDSIDMQKGKDRTRTGTLFVE
jgi:hypothetical protein